LFFLLMLAAGTYIGLADSCEPVRRQIIQSVNSLIIKIKNPASNASD